MKRGWVIVLVAVMFNLFLIMQASAEVTTSISGEYRLRPEFRDNADFDDDASDTQNFYGQRVRLGVDAKINPDLGGFVQLQDTRIWGTDNVLTDVSAEKVDIHQAYVAVKNIKGLPLSLKIGRQEFNYGDQRLIGGFGWSNNGRAFDAIKLMYSHDIADIDFWTAKVAEINACGGGVGCDVAATALTGSADADFYGLYSTFKKNPIPDSNLQAYLLYKGGKDQILETDGDVHWDRRSLKLYTLGGRLAGKVSGIGVDYTGELAYQSGEFIDDSDGTEFDISAYALAIEAGYMIPNVAWDPRVAVEYDYATGSSGADDWDDGDYKAFDNLYPTNHDKYGYMDYQGWTNMQDIALKVSAKPSDKCWLYLAYHMLSLAEDKDDWFWANGRIKFEGAGFGEDEVGQEIDLAARHTFNQNLKVEAGVSQFFAGDFIEAVVEDGGGTLEDSTWAYLMGTVSF